jgi:membrane protein
VSGLWRLLRSRLLSLGMILGIAFLLMVSLIFDMVLQGLGKVWGTGPLEAFAQALNLVIGFGLTTTIFALIYKLMPRAKIEWHDVWVGAAVTALLFTLGKFLISVYIGRSAVASSFGAAGSLVVVMIWVYYSAQIFLLGAEFTRVYAYAHGSRQAPLPVQPLHRAELEPRVAQRVPTERGGTQARPFVALAAATVVGVAAGVLTGRARRRAH